MWTSSRAIFSGGWTKSTEPAAIAERGMSLNLAEASSWANVTPPSALIARSPSAPSDMVPESTTPIARLLYCSARDRMKWSIGISRPRSVGRFVTRKAPSTSPMSALAGMT